MKMKTTFCFSLFLLAGSALANAQSFSVGVLGGAPFQDVVNNGTVNGIQAVARSSNFTIGPSFQVNLPLSLRLEVDALYRPYNFDLTSRTTGVNITAQEWRFPVLAQYRFSTPLVKPFLEGGLSFEHLGNLSSLASTIANGPGQLVHRNDTGIVLGGGVDVKLPLIIRLSGELRYTRQTVSNFASFSNLNQAEVLFGIHF
jgi:hypothetical protein